MTGAGYEKEKPWPPGDYVRVRPERLRRLVTEVMEAVGLRRIHAEIVADNLVTADLFGISSHGVQRLWMYVEALEKGIINPEPRIRIIRSTPSLAVVDGDNGPGQVVGVESMRLAIEMARSTGVGVVLARRSNHYGIAGYYALMAAEEEMIGVSATTTRPLVAYINTLSKYLGTNPIALAAPRRTPPPILFDAATSTVPAGKIEIRAKTGREIPEGWLISLKDGEPLGGDASKALAMLSSGEAALTPLGGAREETGGHKGSGLALIVELLAGVLAGAAWAVHVAGITSPRESNVGHLFAAIDVSAAMPLDEYYDRVEALAAEIKGLRKAPWADNVWIPGEKAWLTKKTREEIGIPLHKHVLEEINRIAESHGVEPIKA